MEAVADALEQLPDGFYGQLACEYCARRDLLHQVLATHGFKADKPAGAYYILADYSALSDLPDPEFATWLTTEIGVTPVPGSSFFSVKDPSRRLVRFAFCKREETLRAAAERLSRLPSAAR
jgi:aminotransferase